MGEAKRRNLFLVKKKEEFMKDKKVLELRANVKDEDLHLFFETMKKGMDSMKAKAEGRKLLGIHIETDHKQLGETTIHFQALLKDSLIIEPEAKTILIGGDK